MQQEKLEKSIMEPAAAQVKSAEEPSTQQDAEACSILVLHCDGYGREICNKANEQRHTAVDVTIWGGWVLNCEESAVARLVRSQRENLRRFIYAPTRTKGGRMIRPHYTDRSSRMTFPSLATLGYYEDRNTPFDALWVVPNLKTLYVFEGNVTGSCILDRWNLDNHVRGNVRFYSVPAPVPGVGAGSVELGNLPRRVLEQSPNLEEIICARPDFSEAFKFQVLRRLIPPQPIPWACLRLLEVTLRKEEDSTTCPLTTLPQNLVDLVVSFCHSPHWKTIDLMPPVTLTNEEAGI